MTSPTARITAALVALALAAASVASPLRATALEPFVASYQAFNKGKLAGSATMRVVRSEAPRWRIDLDIARRPRLRSASSGSTSTRARCSTNPAASTAP